MAEVANMLGVEMNQDFNCNESSCTYRITEHGLTCNGCYGADSLMMILNGEFTIKSKSWKPSEDEIFWHIDAFGNPVLSKWTGHSCNLTLYRVGNCYRTEADAKTNRDKWVSFYASDEILEV
jgi:hypothetical protein